MNQAIPGHTAPMMPPDAPPSAPADPVWRVSPAPVPYPEAVAAMERDVAAIAAGAGPEVVWLLEHPPLYTAGTSARPEELLAPPGGAALPVFHTGRGGRHTYHGPGQRVAYVMLSLRARGMDVRRHVAALEQWVVLSLARLGVAAAGGRPGRTGVWVPRPNGGSDGFPGGGEDKIAAIGVRVRRWVTFHGVAVNVSPDLGHYAGIVPCGLDPAAHGVTSLRALGVKADMDALDAALGATFKEAFKAVQRPFEGSLKRI